jgi:hypothetical protein
MSFYQSYFYTAEQCKPVPYASKLPQHEAEPSRARATAMRVGQKIGRAMANAFFEGCIKTDAAIHRAVDAVLYRTPRYIGERKAASVVLGLGVVGLAVGGTLGAMAYLDYDPINRFSDATLQYMELPTSGQTSSMDTESALIAAGGAVSAGLISCLVGVSLGTERSIQLRRMRATHNVRSGWPFGDEVEYAEMPAIAPVTVEPTATEPTWNGQATKNSDGLYVASHVKPYDYNWDPNKELADILGQDTQRVPVLAA